jgi:hypothetical protein
MCTGTPASTTSLVELPFVASGIEYLSICGLANAGGKKTHWGNSPQWVIFSFKSLKNKSLWD